MTTQALAVIIEHDGADLDLVDVTGERARAEEAALNALAPATRAAYRADWAAFTAWCHPRAYVPLPAPPAVIVMCLPHAAKTLKAASIARRIAAIAYYHEQAGHPSPTAHPIVKNVWKGVRARSASRRRARARSRSTGYGRSWPPLALAASTSVIGRSSCSGSPRRCAAARSSRSTSAISPLRPKASR
jgi:hypothetical protein